MHVRVRAPRGGVRFADVIEILEPSPHRIVPRCRHFGPGAEPRGRACGGCSWQHIAYPEQLRLKSALVDRLVRASLPDAPAARETIAGTDVHDPWRYRHKVHFVFANDPRLVMGHYERGSRRIIPVRECPVHDARGNELAFDLRDAYQRAGVTAAHTESPPASRPRERRSGVLRSIAIRVGANTAELMATLVVADDSEKRLRAATRRLVPRSTAFHVNYHPRGDAFIFGRETHRLAGTERMREEVAGTSFLMSPTGFFQTNVHAAEILVRGVLDAIPSAAEVLDLYAGAGLFALPLARRGHRVLAIEANRAAVADGEASLRLNGIEPGRCRFVARPVEAALGAIRTSDVVILDPPREGCTPPVIAGVFGRLRPARAIYISCNPEALARDLPLIARHSYRVTSLQPVDMFPHTAHVETIAILDRREAGLTRSSVS